MIKRFDSDPDAFGNRFDVMLQGGLGIRVTQVSLDILDRRQLSHIRRTRTSEHLVGNDGHACRLAGFLEDPEKEIIGVDRGTASGGKDECLWGGVLARRSPPLKFCIDRNGNPDASIASLGLGFDLDAICDAAVDSKAVLRLVVPAECEKLARPEPEHEEHANNETVAVAEIKQNNGNLFRREVNAG